jgi:hypothetical protein
MALTAKVRGKWRIVSPAMARVFRARGVTIVDTAAKAVEVRVAPAERVEVEAPALAARDKAATARPAIRKRVTVVEPAPSFDLTDDELEQLTKPGGS